ncbi:NTP transferase domain-containing protein [bacterium]|nr:NTP transferase domain-containing protein [bacterium]
MKGIILAGGNGNRLKPLTEVTNKHLLPIYNKPMIYYPLKTLLDADIRDILIVSGVKHAGAFLQLLGEGNKLGCTFHYRVQQKALGIAQALGLARDFVGNENCAVILGDNIFEDNLSKEIAEHKDSKGAHLFLKEMNDACRFGVAELNGDKVINIEEKPKQPKSNYAVTGLYIFDKNVFDIIAGLQPSNRGEYEITDVNNEYIKQGILTATILKKRWTDAGTFESLFRASDITRDIFIKENYSERQQQNLHNRIDTRIPEDISIQS